MSLENPSKKYENAIRAINPSAIYGIIIEDGVTTIEYLEGTVPIEKSVLDAKIVEQEAAYDALAWSRNRELEYPAVSELTIALYDTDDKAALETKRAAVKTKWPKDNSGPVE